jgi:hypothetical protein
MKKIISTLLIFILTIAAYGQHPLRHLQNIANEAIVIFPDTPRITKDFTNIAYEVEYEDMLYTASSYNVEGASADFLYRNFSKSLYQQSLERFVKSIHGKLIYKKQITEDGVKGMEFECYGTLDTTGYYIFYHTFYHNRKLINVGVWFREETQRNDPRLNAFFSTFKFIQTHKHNSVWSDKTLVIKGVKYALIIILLITLIVGSIIFIIRRSSAKN